ncbi:uL22 family ribosomal protein [Candidatus Karelsulcia muelleri]|uniref:uL22 family ribosomal protein n=1 Tax=Candidatus Karelsulcia muelleri TaxID=336810 RepID=UPI00236384EB|nr:uL22 family ribosomal protein [Candidatus Karelsulcia muelleri]WDE42250.1 uL22 family ribosomal protein [Candidatus Karelsulcia muelleri]WDR79097.1 uL22 family ribosomal protein [Candidatus Karelsulcia muelleri]
MLKKLYYKSNNINYSQIKLIKLINILKSKNIEYIINLLGNLQNKGAIFLKKIILNAYKQNFYKIESQKQNVYLKNIIINKSIMFQKIRPAPQGRANKIKKQFFKMILILKK